MYASAAKVRSIIARFLGARDDVPSVAPQRRQREDDSHPLFSLGESRQELVASYRSEAEQS